MIEKRKLFLLILHTLYTFISEIFYGIFLRNTVCIAVKFVYYRIIQVITGFDFISKTDDPYNDTGPKINFNALIQSMTNKR